MKKLIAVLMAIAMIAALSVTAFAAETIGDALVGEDNITVSGKYNAGVDTPAYKVTLTWDDMTYDYYAAADRTWNVETMTWTETKAAGWHLVSGSNEIRVDNASSVDITATFVWDAEDAYSAVTGSFTGTDEGALTVDAATAGVAGNNGTAGTATTTFEIGGSLADTAVNVTTIGTITVSLS